MLVSVPSGECFLEAKVSVFEVSHFSIGFGVGEPELWEMEADGFIFHVFEDVEGITAEMGILKKLIKNFRMILAAKLGLSGVVGQIIEFFLLVHKSNLL